MIRFYFKIVVISLLFLFCSQQGFAEDWYGAFTYQVSIPEGDTKEFTDDISYRGIGLDFRKSVNPNATVGFLFGWNVFHERTSETMELNTENPGAITGLQDRTINSFPIMVNAHYYFGKDGGIRPYIGMNAGGFFIEEKFDIGIYTVDDSEWQWAVAPEVGILIPLDRSITLIVNAKYNYALTGDSVFGDDVNNEYLTFGIGLAWYQ